MHRNPKDKRLTWIEQWQIWKLCVFNIGTSSKETIPQRLSQPSMYSDIKTTPLLVLCPGYCWSCIILFDLTTGNVGVVSHSHCVKIHIHPNWVVLLYFTILSQIFNHCDRYTLWFCRTVPYKQHLWLFLMFLLFSFPAKKSCVEVFPHWVEGWSSEGVVHCIDCKAHWGNVTCDLWCST